MRQRADLLFARNRALLHALEAAIDGANLVVRGLHQVLDEFADVVVVREPLLRLLGLIHEVGRHLLLFFLFFLTQTHISLDTLINLNLTIF